MAAKPKMMSSLAPTDQWSVKEKLCLASSVMRSGDQNWVSVSRAVKPFAEPSHQPEFFSQRNCARQYSAMLENVETPKRKRSSDRVEVVETPGDLIVKKLTMERLDELKAQIREDKARFKQLKKEIDEIRSGSSDDKLQDMWNEIQSKKKTAEEEAEPSKSTTETVKSASKSSAVPTPGKSRRPPSRTSKTSRTSEGSEVSAIDVTGKPNEDDGDSVFDLAASPDALSSSLAEKHKIDTETQESNDSVGGAEGSDVDVTAVSDVKLGTFTGTSTLSKLLTKGKTPSSSSISPTEPPGSSQPIISSASKASAAKEAAKILLSGAGGGASEDIPKIDIDNTDSNKTIDAAEDSDSNIPTEPPSPSRPEPSDTRGKRKSRGRPASSARRSGRSTRARTADGEDTSEDQSRRPSDSLPDDDGREETRSETAESEETERPSAESDRDDLSSVAAGSLHQSMFADSLPGSPSSVTTEHEHDHTYRIWRKAIMLVWRTIAAHKYANIFLHPVTDDIAPGYCSIVHRRTDLTKIKKSIENGTIRTTEQFYRDIMLMFQNAIMYNNRDHDVYQMANAMQTDAVVYIEEFISTQLMVQQPDSVKMLRSKDGGSRRLDTPAKEETEKPRRGSSEIETSGKKRRTRADEL
ncbi:bromodomain-containing protein 8-like isoform X2 [Amphiura filiformis]|uniref:bromodomain-containing protein 8-like isoform X2 n=1 Tax=Amphiura filiformis TaxID=82378 RepID=UPI003B217809